MAIIVQLNSLTAEQQRIFFRQVNQFAANQSVALVHLYSAGSDEETIQAYLADGSKLSFNDSKVQNALLRHFGLALDEKTLAITVPEAISVRMLTDETCNAIVNQCLIDFPQQMRETNKLPLTEAIRTRFEGQYYLNKNRLYKAAVTSSDFNEQGDTVTVKLNLTTTMVPATTVAVETTVQLPDLYSSKAIDELRVFTKELVRDTQAFNAAPDYKKLDFDTYKQVIVKAADDYITYNKEYRDRNHNKPGLERVKQLKRDIAAISASGQEGISALTHALGACLQATNPSPGAKDFSFVSFVLQGIKGYDLSPLEMPNRPLLSPHETYKQSHGGKVAIRKQFMRALPRPEGHVFAPRKAASEILTAEALSKIITAATSAYLAVHKGTLGKSRATELKQVCEVIMQSTDLDDTTKLAALIAALKVSLQPETGKKPGTRNDSLVAYLLEGNGQVLGLKAYVLSDTSLQVQHAFYPENDYTDACQADLKAFLKQLVKPTAGEHAAFSGYVREFLTTEAAAKAKAKAELIVPKDIVTPSAELIVPKDIVTLSGGSNNQRINLQSTRHYSFDSGKEELKKRGGTIIYDSTMPPSAESTLDEVGRQALNRLRGISNGQSNHVNTAAPVDATVGVTSIGTHPKQRRHSFDSRDVSGLAKKGVAFDNV